MRLGVALAALAIPALVHAAHPFVTEDPGTQGAGRFELELGFGAFQGDPSIAGRNSIFATQLSIGFTDNVDLSPRDLAQSRSSIGLLYVLLARGRFGAVEWRKPPE